MTAQKLALRALAEGPSPDGEEKLRRYYIGSKIYKAAEEGIEVELSEGDFNLIRDLVKRVWSTWAVGAFHEFCEKELQRERSKPVEEAKSAG